MSEPTRIEEQQQAPVMRETVTGPLLPRWFTTLFYVIFVPFCLYSTFHVVRSVRTQHTLAVAINLLMGTLTTPAESPDSAAGRKILGVLGTRPLESFLYLNQTLLQNEEDDPRMARALALRRAMDWGRVSAERDVVERILAHMNDDGSLQSAFSIDKDMQQVLDQMVKERRSMPDATYVEDRITDVLDWLAKGHVGQPVGTEKKRLAALNSQYAKKVFVGSEAGALKAIADAWQGDVDPLRQQTAAAFYEMLKGQRTELSPEAKALCTAEADQWEKRYREGVLVVAIASREMVAEIVKKNTFLDHPHIYQYISMLDYDFDDVRKQVAEGTWLMRHHRFAIRFIAYFATKATVNPFMAVETLRLTKEEHERELRRANERRMVEAEALLGRIGVDYVQHPDDYKSVDKNPQDYMRRFIVSALSEVVDEPVIGPPARKALDEIRAAEGAQPGGPKLFTSSPQ